MTLIQELINQAAIGGLMNAQTIKRFSPSEIRETIQSLVANEQLDLACALGDAGLSIYPHSEDMLAICSLLAMTNQNWQEAVELMEELMAKQGETTPPFTFVMMVRALRCNLEPARALEVVRKALAIYPEQLELVAEKLALDDFSSSLMPVSKVGHKHQAATQAANGNRLPFQRQKLATEYFYVQRNVKKLSEKGVLPTSEEQNRVGTVRA